MQHLAHLGHIVPAVSAIRLGTTYRRMSDRGGSGATRSGFTHEVEAERVPLYEQHADATLDVGDQSMDDALNTIAQP